MASDTLELVARLRAFEVGHAIPIATHRQVAIRPDAMVLCPLMMAGEDTTIHIVAVGRVSRPAEIYAVADPRLRDDQYELFEWLGDRIEDYWGDCRRAGTYPQVWVSSSPVQAHLDNLAERLRYNRINVKVRRCGELLSYVTDRYPISGQQALRTVTEALRLHWSTGQMESEDEHLLVLKTWHEPPLGRNILAAVSMAELVPMGVKTDPAFDRDVLAALVTRFNTSRRAGASAHQLAQRARAIRNVLEPEVMRIYEATQWAIARLTESGLLPLPALSDLEKREAEAFESFMNSRDSGYGIPLRDSAKAAVFKLTEREDAIEQYESALIIGDRICQARARLAGRIITGRVENPTRTWIAPYHFEYRLELVTVQRRLRVRPRDEFCSLSDPRLRVTVTNTHRTGSTVRIFLRVVAGQRSVGLPTGGMTLELGPAPPSWSWISQERKQLGARLTITPWTHDERGIPTTTPRRDTPPDPLAAIEALR